MLDQLIVSLPVAATSKRNILSGWRLYIKWLEQEGGTLLQADPAQAQAYAAWLQHTYAAPATINNRLAQNRKLYRLLQHLGLSTVNPFEDLHGIINPADERRPYYLPEEIERLLAHADLEHQVLLLLGAHAGLTGPEIVQLQYEDCDSQSIQVSQRIIEQSTQLKETFAKWRHQQGERPLLTPKLEGKMFKFRDDQELRARIWKLCQQANVDYRGWYALRNAAGIQMLSQKGARSTERQLGLGGRAALHPTTRLVKKRRSEEK
ncbi:integrase [Deinococcus sp.]|uniref:integrase n=1 Tax=Deinococcus sp. TaxID=47478 RepID=UPI0025BD13F6|nr:integrase [Deinococcus sp.]